MSITYNEDDRRPVANANTPGAGIKSDCNRVQLHRKFYKEGSLREMDSLIVEKHLELCEECAKYYED